MANHNLTDLLPDWYLLPASGSHPRRDSGHAMSCKVTL